MKTGARRGPMLVRVAMILAVVNLLVSPLLVYGAVRYVIYARQRARTVQSMSNLRQLSFLVSVYSVENRGYYPADLGQANTLRLSATIYRSPVADPSKPAVYLPTGPCDYIYVPPAIKQSQVRGVATVPMIYEPPANYGNAKTVIAFADGHVEVVSGTRMTTLIAQIEANRAPATQPASPPVEAE